MIDVKYCELHKPIFVGGTNLGEKLDTSKRTGLALHLDDNKQILSVGWNGETAYIPQPNLAMWIEGKFDGPRGKVQQFANAHGKPIRTAQVETPQSHVFAGPGSGNKK